LTPPSSAAARVAPLELLTARELDTWHAMQAANPVLDSPYFHPGFAQAVHASGQDVRVVVGTAADGNVESLLAFHRHRSRMRPVGWPGADFQGPVVGAGTSLNPLRLLAGGAKSFEFDHLVAACPNFDRWISSRRASPYLDVSGGLDGYLGRASRSGKDNMGQARRRAAKAERELGPVRFAVDTVDPQSLDRVIEFKRAQYRATGANDYFADPRRRDLLHLLLHTRDSSFGGVLSTLHAGPHLIAAHFGMRAGNVLHWWFPVYDPDFGPLSPGWILLRELVAAAPQLGITRIDLGRGDDEYKRRAKTGETIVSQGMVTGNSMLLAARHVKESSLAVAKASPIGPPLRTLSRTLRGRR
jgi:CelD/BcsL family acetyltransferase involved in cellulose biosynthesis